MSKTRIVRNLVLSVILITGLFFLTSLTQTLFADPGAVVGSAELAVDGTGWAKYPSPVLADIDGNGLPEVIVGTAPPGNDDGYVMAFSYENEQLTEIWRVNLQAPFYSSPAAADVDGDGDLEIALGVGYRDGVGRIVLLDHLGNELWEIITEDREGKPNGIPDGVKGTPALGDINGDGFLEVVVAALDENVYAINYQGGLLPGWPVAMKDNTQGSPALADLNQDGLLDVIVGGYANKHASPCPDKGCGRLFAFDYTGTDLPGWPVFELTHFDSSVAVGDLDGDGAPELVIGSGINHSGDDRFDIVYAYEADGSPMNGWPRTIGDYAAASPAIADVDDDGDMEIFIASNNCKLYGFSHNGNHLPGWPVSPTDPWGYCYSKPHPYSPTIIDADSDGQVEIFQPSGSWVVGYELNGTQMSDAYALQKSSTYEIVSTPAWGDLDGDGRLEAVLSSAASERDDTLVIIYDLNAAYSEETMMWPMWRQNAFRTGSPLLPPNLLVSPGSLFFLQERGSNEIQQQTVALGNIGRGIIDWTAQVNGGGGALDVAPLTGQIDIVDDELEVSLDGPGLSLGTHQYTITISGTDDNGETVNGSPAQLGVTVMVVNEVSSVFIPGLER